jgi:hypothetical protein
MEDSCTTGRWKMSRNIIFVEFTVICVDLAGEKLCKISGN